MVEVDAMKAQTRTGAKVVFFLLVIFILPVSLTLNSVLEPVHLIQTSTNPTPYGYTISLLLFIIPMLSISIWLYRKQQAEIQKTAFWMTVLLLAPTGIILDVLFGNMFFSFENHSAVIGITFPAIGGDLPVEEIVFYISGFITILLIYVWCDEYWFEKYNIPDYTEASLKPGRILQFHPWSLVAAFVIITCAVLYKKLLADDPEGFPGYMIYLTIVALTPAMALYNSVKRYINWRAFSFTVAIVVLISLIWEVTLALPYQWWGFNGHAMVGIYIEAWHNLPIEEIILWISVSYATVTTYEGIKIWRAQCKKM